MHTAERQAGKFRILIFMVFSWTTTVIEPSSTVLVAGALCT